MVIIGSGNPGQNVALLEATNVTNTFSWRANVTPNSNGVFEFVEWRELAPPN